MIMKQGIFLRAPSGADATEAVIDVVGVIGWDVGFQQLREILAAIPETVGRIVFDIYSPGGDVWDGNAMIHEIGALKQETVARVRVAASMATLIAVACKRREMSANGRWLVHNPWTATQGDAEEFEKRAKELRDAESEAAEFYAKRTGKTSDEMRALMAEERWLTPAEAKAYGFVDAIIDPFDVAAFAPVREAITAAGKWPHALAEIPNETEVNDAHSATDGAAQPENVGSVQPTAPAVPDEELARQLADALGAEYARGHDDGITECANAIADAAKTCGEAIDRLKAEHKAKCDAIEAGVAELRAKLAESESRAAKHQSERDRANAEVARMRETLDQARQRLERHIGGAMRFSPAVETWEDALKLHGGDYAAAATKFPELLKVYRAKHAQKG